MKSQICQVLARPSCKQKLHAIGMPSDDAEELFFLLDVDNSGLLSVQEFVGGVQKMKASSLIHIC